MLRLAVSTAWQRSTPRRTQTPACGWMSAYPARPRGSTPPTGFEDTEALPEPRAGGLGHLRGPDLAALRARRRREAVRDRQHGQLCGWQDHHGGEGHRHG